MKPTWESKCGTVQLYLGDCLEVLPTLAPGSVDAVVTDPPYSSGGAFRSDRTQKTVAKYVKTGAIETCRDEFSGDNRDQRAFLAWCSMWLLRCHDLVADGGVLVLFIDWRQLPILTDAIQCGGWCWRGIATWWKPGVRMVRGRFSSSAEYVLYASRGVPTDGESSPQNVFQCAPVPGDEKEHVAQKPVDVLQWAASVAVAGGIILDPFAGSGTAGVAAIRSGRKYVGIEKDERSFEVTRCRLFDELDKVAFLEPPKRERQLGLLEEVK